MVCYITKRIACFVGISSSCADSNTDCDQAISSSRGGGSSSVTDIEIEPQTSIPSGSESSLSPAVHSLSSSEGEAEVETGDNRISIDSGYIEDQTETIGANTSVDMVDSVRSDDELNSLLLAMTPDQITEVFNALETEPSSSSNLSSYTDDTTPNESSPPVEKVL